MTTLAETFRNAFARNAGVAHGPLDPAGAVNLACDRILDLAHGEAVAVPAGALPVGHLSMRDALTARGLALVSPDHPEWREVVAGCLVGVTDSLAAVARTGTFAVGCGPGTPRAISLVPDAHVGFVAASSIDATFEEAFARATAAGLAPNLVWISGPSRSADIEKRITLGVHGPRTVEVVIVDA